jgi:uncharacterized protein (DUF697 family)
MPQQHLALGRQFPLFRLTIARQLINETCYSNAAYSFSTGLAEIVPVLDLPLNVTDMVVLTKSQAFLAYKLGLLLGFSTRWQDYVKEFGSVIGGGFLWRQIARGLIGPVPGWGLIPKVAVTYSGTYVVGNAILGWYLTGRNLSPQQMRALYSQAFIKGREYARKLGEKIPRPRFGKRKTDELPAAQKKPALAEGEIVISKKNSQPQGEPSSTGSDTLIQSTDDQIEKLSGDATVIKRGLAGKQTPAKPARSRWWMKKKAVKPVNTRICPQCGKASAADASFCQYCGTPYDQ